MYSGDHLGTIWGSLTSAEISAHRCFRFFQHQKSGLRGREMNLLPLSIILYQKYAIIAKAQGNIRCCDEFVLTVWCTTSSLKVFSTTTCAIALVCARESLCHGSSGISNYCFLASRVLPNVSQLTTPMCMCDITSSSNLLPYC